MSQRYWKGMEELRNEPEFTRLKNNEFYENLPLDELVQKKSDGSSNMDGDGAFKDMCSLEPMDKVRQQIQ